MARTILIHEWVGLLIMVLGIAGLITSVWSIVQNTVFYEAPIVPPDIPEVEKVRLATTPSLMQRIGWNIPGVFMSLLIFGFGYWTYRRGKDGVPLVSVK